jgi:acyl carrier protein
MNDLQLRTVVAEVLEVNAEDLRPEIQLESFPNYDSTARLSLMICLSDLTGQAIELCSLQKLTTYGDVMALVEQMSGEEMAA